MMKKRTRRRIVLGAVIGAVLTIFVVGMLAFADSYTPDEALRCTARFIQSKWPAYLGCVMGRHEGLAAGLMGGAGALFGAWLAFHAVQEQILEERNLRKKQQKDVKKQQKKAKPAAILCIGDSVQAASALLYHINYALASDPQHPKYDGFVDTNILRLGHCIDNFIVRESLSNLGVVDRRKYLIIIRILFGCVNASAAKTPTGDRRIAYLKNLQKILMQLHRHLGAFDRDLASEFAWDSWTSLPSKIDTLMMGSS
jgi:hypothetical protein